jgi:NADPH:quinone reductase-like Zn-dependent oxidoreductase
VDTYIADLGYRVEEFPVTLGFNAAGTVAAVGAGVRALVVGDRVSAFVRGVIRVLTDSAFEGRRL